MTSTCVGLKCLGDAFTEHEVWPLVHVIFPFTIACILPKLWHLIQAKWPQVGKPRPPRPPRVGYERLWSLPVFLSLIYLFESVEYLLAAWVSPWFAESSANRLVLDIVVGLIGFDLYLFLPSSLVTAAPWYIDLVHMLVLTSYTIARWQLTPSDQDPVGQVGESFRPMEFLVIGGGSLAVYGIAGLCLWDWRSVLNGAALFGLSAVAAVGYWLVPTTGSFLAVAVAALVTVLACNGATLLAHDGQRGQRKHRFAVVHTTSTWAELQQIAIPNR